MATGLVSHSGLLDTSPLRKFLEDYFDAHGHEFYRKVEFGSVDANTGDF